MGMQRDTIAICFDDAKLTIKRSGCIAPSTFLQKQER